MKGRGYGNRSPDWLSMLLSVFGGMSLSGCFTVTRPLLTGCLNWR